MASPEVEITEEIVSSLVLAAMIMWFDVLHQPLPAKDV